MFIFNKDTFNKGWGIFIKENPSLFDEIYSYIYDFFYDMEDKDLLEFFTEDFKYVKDNNHDWGTNLVGIEIEASLGQPSFKTIKDVTKKLISKGENAEEIERFFDELFEDYDRFEFLSQTLVDTIIEEIEDKIGLKVYWVESPLSRGNEFLGVKAKDLISKIYSLPFYKEIDDQVVKDLILFKGDFEELGEELYNELEKIYNVRKEEFNSIIEFLDKIYEENTSFFIDFFTLFIEDKYLNNSYDFLKTFVKDVEEKKEIIKEIEEVFKNSINKINEMWEIELENTYLNREDSFKEEDENY